MDLMRRVCGAVGMGIMWAVAWAIPAFVGGDPFSLVRGVAARHRRFDEISLPRFTLRGAGGGVPLSLVPAALIAVGLASVGESVPSSRTTASREQR